MGRDWPVDGLEFLNSAGSHRFRLKEAVAGGPIFLLRAPADAPDERFEDVPSSAKKAIPVVALLAYQAVEGAGISKKDWIYDVVWQNKSVNWRYNAALLDSKRNTLENLALKIRKLIGEETLEAVDGGYRLTVPVYRTPIEALPPIPGTEVPSSVPAANPTPEPGKPISPAEIRSEERTGIARLAPIAPRRIQWGAIARIGLSVTSFVFFLVVLFRHPSPYATNAIRYGFFTFVIVIGTSVVAAIIFKVLEGRKRPNDKIVIYVARFGTDKLSNDTQELLFESIRENLPSAAVEIRTARIQLKTIEEDEEQARQQATRFLQRNDGDVLIWGKVYALPQMKARVALRFATQRSFYRPDGKFGIADDTQLLDSTFGPELGGVVAAVASSIALPSVRYPSIYLSTVLRPIADRLSRLLSNVDHMYAIDRGCILHSYGHIQFAIGDETGEDAPIKQAEGAFREATKEISRERLPQLWALAQNSLGLALLIMGEREAGTERLKDAVAAFRAAADEWSGPNAKSYRAMALNNMGISLRFLGEREKDSENLKSSVTALRASLDEGTLADTSLRPAIVLSNLGTSLVRLGQREAEAERAKEAVATVRQALEKFDRLRHPLHWSMTQNNLAIALTALCERETEPHLLAEAAEAFRLAADARTRDRMPLKWAAVQINLGATLVRLAESDGNHAMLREAVAVTQAALGIPMRDRDPFLWATAQNTLGFALMKLGEAEENILQLKESDAALLQALEEWKREHVPASWAMATNNRGFALMLLGQWEASRERLEDAIDAFLDAAEVCTRETDLLNWAVAQNGLALTLLSLGTLEPGTARMEESVATYRAILDELKQDHSQDLFKGTREALEQALSVLRERAEQPSAADTVD